jgi:hypothetical protein
VSPLVIAAIVITFVIGTFVITFAVTFVIGAFVLTMFPMSGDETPAFPAINPPGCNIALAGPLSFPLALVPHVPVAIPKPVAWRPDVADAWRRDGLDTDGRRRRSNDDIQRDLRRRDEWPSRTDAKGEQRQNCNERCL